MEKDKNIKTSRASETRSKQKDLKFGLHHHLWMHHLRQTDLDIDG